MYAGQIVERGPAEEITQQPKHPYTQLLVSSAPDPDHLGSTLRTGGTGAGAQRVQRVKAAEGFATQGCPFSPRCPLADEQCREENPALLPLSDTRAAACWHVDEAGEGIRANS
jgi:peptide/nickel transport system ATP-binding protein